MSGNPGLSEYEIAQAKYVQRMEAEHTRMWNTLVSIAAMASRPMNGHTAGNAIGRARNAITLIERDRERAK